MLVWNALDETHATAARLRDCAQEIWQRGGLGGGLVHSVWGNFQPQMTNTILGDTPYLYRVLESLVSLINT